MKIAVRWGNERGARGVLASGAGDREALRERGHEVGRGHRARLRPADARATSSPRVHAAPPSALEGALDPIKLADVEQIRQADVAFLALHGGAGEDGTVQALLDLMGVRYTGSGPLGSGIAMDKDVSKRLFRDAQVPTLPWRVARAPGFAYDTDIVEDLIGLPCIVKPSRQGSSVGITVVADTDELAAAVQEASQFDTEVMIERYAKGRSSRGDPGDQALPPVEIRPKKGIYTTTASTPRG